MADSALRLRLYRRLADVNDDTQVAEVAREFQGALWSAPGAAENLLYLLRVKLAATRVNAATVTLDDGRIMVRFREEDNGRMDRLNKKFGNRVRASWDRMWLQGPEIDKNWRQHLIETLGAAVKS